MTIHSSRLVVVSAGLVLVAFLAYALANGSTLILLLILFPSVFFLLRIFYFRSGRFGSFLASKNPALKYFLIYGALIVWIFWSAVARNGMSAQEVLAFLLLVMVGYPLWRYLKRTEAGVPWIPIIALAYGFYYALPVLLPIPIAPEWSGVSEQSRIYAQTLVLIGFSIFLLTFYKWPRKTWRKIIPQLREQWSEKKAKSFALFLAVTGLASNGFLQMFSIPVQWREPLNYCAQFSLVAVAVLIVLLYENRLVFREKFFLVLLVILEVLLDMGTEAVFPVIRLGTLLFMLYLLYKRDLPLKWGLIVLAMVVLLLATKLQFREVSLGVLSGNPLKRGIAFARFAYTFLTQASPQELYFGVVTVAHRFDMISVFADIVNKTPYRVPYWNGHTFLFLFWKFIPRVLYPDKPMEWIGQEFGHRYGLVDPTDFTTAMNLPQLVEMYANFGVAGVIIGTFLLGLICQAADDSINRPEAHEWGVVSSAVIFSAFINIESNFSLTYGNLVNWIIVMYFLGGFVRKTNPKTSLEISSPPLGEQII